MKRFTLKTKTGGYVLINPRNTVNIVNGINKFGADEDLEQMLSMELKVFVKLCLNGFCGYVKNHYDGKLELVEFSPRDFIYDENCKVISTFYQDDDEPFYDFKLKNYGKKTEGGWALTKEELK